MPLTKVMYMMNKYEMPRVAEDRLRTLMSPDALALVKVELQIAYITGRTDGVEIAEHVRALKLANRSS